MKKIVYWMYLQMFIGGWLFISPLVMGYAKMSGWVASDMILGAVLVLLGLSVIIESGGGCEESS